MSAIGANFVSFYEVLGDELSQRMSILNEQIDSRFEIISQQSEDKIEVRKTMNDRIVEELRPLCEELPPDALDPVTFEPLNHGLNFRCGHSLNTETVAHLARIKGVVYRQETIDCPVCKTPQIINRLSANFPFRGCLLVLQKINAIFVQDRTKNDN
jgi:hypothetical protein